VIPDAQIVGPPIRTAHLTIANHTGQHYAETLGGESMQDTTLEAALGSKTRMDWSRRAALSAGLLFITATVTSVVGTGLSRPFVTAPDYLGRVSAHASQVTAGALFEFIAAAASAGIAISLYPVLRKWHAGLALGSVVFRTMEALMYTVGVVGLLSLLRLSQQFTRAGVADRASLQAIGDSLLGARDQATLAGVLAFSLGALMYYYLFYQSRLVPRWLSGWGLVAILLTIAACLVAWFSQRPLTTYTIVLLPIAVQEMVLAVWLIAKGFSSSALQSGAPLEQWRGND
jgi:hypothetical protein